MKGRDQKEEETLRGVSYEGGFHLSLRFPAEASFPDAPGECLGPASALFMSTGTS